MANETNSPNMSLPIPGVGQTDGPTWASDLNSSLLIIDGHDHSSGSGVPITPSGLNINADLSANNNNVTNLRSVRLQVQSALLAGASDLDCLYVNGVDLYYNDGSGNKVRITQSGAVAGTPGSISNLVAPASASYSAGNQTFVWQSDASTPANLDCASIILRNLLASSHGLTLAPPAAMGADYTLTLPTLPASTKIMSLTSSGTLGASYDVDNSSIEISSNTLRVKAQGITQADINLRATGSSVAAGGFAKSYISAYSDNHTSYQAVGSVTITTLGNPVAVGLDATNVAGVLSQVIVNFNVSADQLIIGISRDAGATFLSEQVFGVNGTPGITGLKGSPSQFRTVDFPAAGTYTYTLYAKLASSSSNLLEIRGAALFAYEIK